MKAILRSIMLIMLCSLAAGSAAAQVCQGPGSPVNGSINICTDFRVALLDIGSWEPGFDVTDEGWVLINRSHGGPRTRCVSGVVTKNGVASNDTSANHTSHDGVVHLEVDPGQQDALSNVNGPNNGDRDNDLDPNDDAQTITPTEIEIEWETGIRPADLSGDGLNPIFPKWVWPSPGDRAWADGNWVFDCGHGKEIGHIEIDPNTQLPVFVGAEYFRSEIHPARAFASMRQQVGTLPGSGSTPVPVTAVDLYIHGRGGFVTDILNCGMDIIIDGVDEDGDGDGDGNPEACPNKTTPIDDTFQFEVCLPKRPHPAASLAWIVEAGPGDTIPSVVPDIDDGPASNACTNDGDGDPNVHLYDTTTSLLVTIPLEGTGVAPTEVYARKIRAGWVFPDADLRHLTVTLQKMDLHNDTDDVPADTGELTFFWMSVDEAPEEWARLSDFDIPTYDDCGTLCPDQTNTMNDYDDDGLCCNGELNFSGPTFDFFVAGRKPFTIRAQGYDQDCYDFYNGFTNHNLTLGLFVACHTVDIDEYGASDALRKLPVEFPDNPELASLEQETTFGYPGYGVGFQDLHAWKLINIPGVPQPVLGSDYELEVMIGEVPLDLEDEADLSVVKACQPDGEVALVGEPFHCTITVGNAGPGLPRDVVIDDTLSGPGAFELGPASMTVGKSASVDCTSTGSASFTCDPGTVPVGGEASVTVDVTALAGGQYVNRASSSTDSTDPEGHNDEDETTIDVFLSVSVDIKPGTSTNPVTPGGRGSIPVAILSDPTFDATTVDPLTACFGDAEAPTERDCVLHNKARLQDVDRDGDLDLLLHFDVPDTGIDDGDVRACLIARLTGGVGVYGCDVVSTSTPRLETEVSRERRSTTAPVQLERD